MSRGRARHQVSRRRMYSVRQRDLRERRLHAAREAEQPNADEMTAIEIESVVEPEVAPITIPLRRGATAA